MNPYHYYDFPSLEIQYLGSPVNQGRRATVIYFSLCAHESLNTDPFNQPAIVLEKQGIRVFSITLPGHGPNFDKYRAMQYWAENLDEVIHFTQQCKAFVKHLMTQQLVEGHVATMGLSRGGIIATLVGSLDEVEAILGFAPVSDFNSLIEFQGLDIPKELSYNSFLDQLIHKKIRCYIGNRDVRVNTKSAFKMIQNIAEHAYEKRIRSCPAEMFISASTGQMGHGTLFPIFEQGAHWLKNQIV